MLLQQRLPVFRMLEEHRAEGAVNTGCNCGPQYVFGKRYRRPSTVMPWASHTSAVNHP